MEIVIKSGGSEAKSASQKPADEFTFEEIIGRSHALLCQINTARNFAQEDGAVLIRGETGTGKDLFARAIHYCSHRKNRPFLPINCATLPANLSENELFGHASGAFTGAQRVHRGLIEEANDGTLFLDEIDSLAPEVQPKLLRLLEQGETRRLGDTLTRRVNVRVICATNKDLRLQVHSHRFRSDLYYRLDVFSLSLPPLRDRREDIPSIAEYYFKRRLKAKVGPDGQMGTETTSITPEVMERLCGYHWPGNVRELKNVIDRAFALCKGGRICVGDLRLDEHEMPMTNRQYKFAKKRFEANYLEILLSNHNFDTSLAQEASGLSRSAFYALLRKHKIPGHHAVHRRRLAKRPQPQRT